MLILYYWPGASSMVPHIVLEEIGTPYQRQLVNLVRGEHKSAAYLKINPHGKIPALAIDNTVLTENVAILTYLARRFPEAHLLPDGAIEEARCLSTMAWFASAVHTTFAHIIRPERFATDKAAHGNLKETARDIFWDNCKEINELLDGKAWMMGTHYTVCDPYALVTARHSAEAAGASRGRGFLDGVVRVFRPSPTLSSIGSFVYRESELGYLTAGEVNAAAKQMIIRIVQSKGRKDRHVMLPAEVLDLLRQWWKARPTKEDAGVAPEQRWLFPGRSDHQPLTTRQFSRLFKEAAKAAGANHPQDGSAERHP